MLPAAIPRLLDFSREHCGAAGALQLLGELEQRIQALGRRDFTSASKGSLVEQALLHHLQALRELPQDIVIPPRIRVSRASFEQVVDLVNRPRKPTAAIADLMSGPKKPARRAKRARSRG
jgi:hypothetical protein